jgi:hypothetical protein
MTGTATACPTTRKPGQRPCPRPRAGGYATLAVPDGQALKNVKAVTPPPGAPEGVQFPNGLFSFKIGDLDSAGDCTTTTLYLARNTAINTYYKYGKTADNPTDHWYAFLYDGRTGAEIMHDAGRTRIVLHLCDGERGDSDLTANGRIDEPGGPGVMGGAPPIPTLSEWGMILFIGLMLLAGIRFLRRSGSPTSAAA